MVVSSEGQREDLADYLRMAHEDAAKNGWTIEREGEYREVASGKKGVRSPVLKLLVDLEAMPPELRPQWLWCRRTDRFSRGPAAEATMVKLKLHSLGVEIWDHDRGHIKISTAQDELLENVAGFYARFDNEVRAGKTRATHAKRRLAGLPVGFRRPYGLAWTPTGDVAVPGLADAVRQAFAWRIEGIGVAAIAQRLATFAPPYRFKDHETPVRWSNKRVWVLLRTRAYISTIVDEVTWQRAQHAKPGGRRKRRFDYALRGALRCWCGRLMGGGGVARGDYVWRYYRCDATWAHNGKARLIPALDAEAVFERLLRSGTVTPRVREAYRRGQNDIPSAALLASALLEARKQLPQIEKARSAAWELHMAGKIGDDELAPRLAHLKAEHERIAAQLSELEVQEQLLRHAKRIERDALELWERAAKSYPKALPSEREEIARMIAGHFGLCCEPDGNISLRRPIDPNAQQRRAR